MKLKATAHKKGLPSTEKVNGGPKPSGWPARLLSFSKRKKSHKRRKIENYKYKKL